MAGIQLSGLASGFDWKSLVDQLMALNRAPQNKLRTEKTLNLGKLSSFASLRTKLAELGTAAASVGSETSFAKRAATLSDADLKWTALAAEGATAGSFKFNVTQLASNTVTTGASNRGSGLNTTNDVSSLLVPDLRLATAITSGEFTVNGARVTVAETDTLQDVFTKISTATGGGVTAGYDAATDRVSLAGTGTITLGSGTDTSNFLYALKLYNNSSSTNASASALGTLQLRETIASAGLGTAVTGSGTFVINGVTIAYDADTDSLAGLMTRVNESAAGVTMSYDAAGDRFKLQNKSSGDVDLVVGSDSGGMLTALGLSEDATTARGKNAIFTIDDGSSIVSASNSLTSSAHGVTGLTVTISSTGTQTVKVSADTASVEKNIRDFVAKFNSVQSYIDEQTRVTTNSDGSVTTATMAKNREYTDLAARLRGAAFDVVSGASSTLQRLESLGIDFNGSSSQLQIRDESKLKAALANDFEGVSKLFTTASSGIAERISTYVTQMTKSGGNLTTQEATIERQNSSLDRQIADIERHLATERSRLEASFIRMEQAQQQINSQLAALQNAFPQTLGQ